MAKKKNGYMHAPQVLRYTNVAHFVICATYLSRDPSRIFL